MGLVGRGDDRPYMKIEDSDALKILEVGQDKLSKNLYSKTLIAKGGRFLRFHINRMP